MSMCSWKVKSQPTIRINVIGINVSNQTVIKSGIGVSSEKKEREAKRFMIIPVNRPDNNAAIMPLEPSFANVSVMLPSSNNGLTTIRKKAIPARPACFAVLA